MVKIKISVSIDAYFLNQLDDLAKRLTNGNRSKAFEQYIMAKTNKLDLYTFLAKQSLQQFNLFKELKDREEEKQKEREKAQMQIQL